MLMERVVGQGASLALPWKKSEDRQQQAFGHLALAIMNDELERTDDAVAHYQAARDLLTELSASQPSATQYQVALGDCFLQLGRLRMKEDRAAAEKDFGAGQVINKQLAAQHDNARLRAGWYEAELQQAVVRGFDKATENLQRAEQITRDFGQKVVQDPAQLYELACYLGGREPILLTWQSNRNAK
jgi:hypothetical protein